MAYRDVLILSILVSSTCLFGSPKQIPIPKQIYELVNV